jgi:type VI secretion system protein ImpC
MPGRLEFDVAIKSTGSQTGYGVRSDRSNNATHFLFLGNFSGHNGERESIAGPFVIDIDNFDSVLRRVQPRLNLRLGAEDDKTGAYGVVTMEIGSMEDFHPDLIYEKSPLFQQLRELRVRLSNPKTFAQAAKEVTGLQQTPAESRAPDEEAVEGAVSQDSGGDLNALLEKPTQRSGAEASAISTTRKADISAFIHNVIAPDIEPGLQDDQQELIAAVDRSISNLMRRILHHPEFQALEANWRAVNEFLTRVEAQEEVVLHILDLAKSELERQVKDNLSKGLSGPLYKLLVEDVVQVPGGALWTMLIGLYSFSNTEDDIQVLTSMGQLAQACGGPFLAAGSNAIIGSESAHALNNPSEWKRPDEESQKRWQVLRRSISAQWLGLVLPRFLLRLPYGRLGEDIERFRFEEFDDPNELTVTHEKYLWGNPAVACAILVAQSFQENGWELQLGRRLDLDELPLHAIELSGEKTIKPCAETLISETSANAIARTGIMPLMSYKNKNAVHLFRFQSLSERDANLAGFWSE